MSFDGRSRVAAALLVASCLAIGGCAASTTARVPADREAISREMALVVNYESKRNDLRKAVGLLMLNGMFDADSGKQVKESMDIEYVYYEASLVSLAHGNMDDYRKFVQLADDELSRAKNVMTARVEAWRAANNEAS